MTFRKISRLRISNKLSHTYLSFHGNRILQNKIFLNGKMDTLGDGKTLNSSFKNFDIESKNFGVKKTKQKCETYNKSLV